MQVGLEFLYVECTWLFLAEKKNQINIRQNQWENF